MAEGDIPGDRTRWFEDYLASEEQNLRASVGELAGELDIFTEVDGLYHAALEMVWPHAVLGQLFMLTHCCLYQAVSKLLRCHLSDCLASCRTAVDATLTAYQIALEPATLSQYVARDGMFLGIKKHVKRLADTEPLRHGHLKPLLEVHEACSRYGSHADYDSFLYRGDEQDMDISHGVVGFDYFQLPPPSLRRWYFFVVLQVFLSLLEVYSDSALSKATDARRRELNANIRALNKRVGGVRQAAHQESVAKDGGPEPSAMNP